ncbi:glycosyltransferase [Parabacteroides chinchillae]
MSCEININMSVVVPVYNVEEYLPACIESLLDQDISVEIILINDGSTDGSGVIADQYANQDKRIKVIHQGNGGASAARNTGLEIAQGEYIAFIDSDDWVKQNSLGELYREAIKYQADVIMGNNMLAYNPDGSLSHICNPVPEDLRNIFLSGKEGFVKLSETGAYPSMACNYIYSRKYLNEIQIRFEEGIMHEDELWCPIVLYQAEKFLIANIDFYCYRQRPGSVMHASSRQQRMKALFRVGNRLTEFAGHLDFMGEDGELKNWLYVRIFMLYSKAFMFLSQIKDTSYVVPQYHLDRFWRDCWEMMPEPQKRCKYYYDLAVANLQIYTNWCTSEWVASVAYQIKSGKKLMLIYNAVRGENLHIKNEVIPANWLITTDRRYFQQADVVVFYLPDLAQEVEGDLDKPEDQIWVAWHLEETEKNYPWVNDPEFKELFDLQVYYPEDEKQEEHPVIQLCRAINNKLDKNYES